MDDITSRLTAIRARLAGVPMDFTHRAGVTVYALKDIPRKGPCNHITATVSGHPYATALEVDAVARFIAHASTDIAALLHLVEVLMPPSVDVHE